MLVLHVLLVHVVDLLLVHVVLVLEAAVLQGPKGHGSKLGLRRHCVCRGRCWGLCFHVNDLLDHHVFRV
jgi:hypothetical protein